MEDRLAARSEKLENVSRELEGVLQGSRNTPDLNKCDGKGAQIRLDRDFVMSDFSEVALPDLPDIPGMITDAEGRYLYWLASEVYEGRGAIHELGTWLGRSTSRLAAGLAAAHDDAQMNCFDHFRWSGGTNWDQKTHTVHARNEDFMPEFLANLGPYAARIRPVRTKISEISLPDEAVEIMVLDAPKRLRDISASLTQIAGRTIPSTTILAWQDFMHGASFEIPATLYALRDKLSPIHSITTGCMLAFRVTDGWRAEEVSVHALDFSHWSSAECVAVWEYWLPAVSPSQQPAFRIGLAMLLHDLGHAEAANEETVRLARTHGAALAAKMAKWGEGSLRARYAPVFAAFEAAAFTGA